MTKSSNLSTTVLKSVSIRVLVVILVSSTISYFHLFNTIETGMKDTLQQYVNERVKREESLFLLAQKNHSMLKDELEKKLFLPPTAHDLTMFDQLTEKLPDGTTRSKKSSFDGTKIPGIFIPPNLKITDDLKHRVVVMYELAQTYGQAFRNRFQDTYFVTSENIIVVLWPESPNWALEMKSDFNMLAEEYVWVADRKHNPNRTSVWTGAFYDKVGKTWMTSIETPIDAIIDGKQWSATIGHDVMLTDFVAQVSSEHLTGTYNIIFRDDGRLITHPNLINDIEKNDGNLNLQTSNDAFLKDIYKKVISTNPNRNNQPAVVLHPNGKDLLAFSKIGGPDWNFVTIFPKELITSTALSGISFIILLALASLVFEIFILYFGLKRDVISPLMKLEESVKKITDGEYDTRVEITRTDELGQLAKSFNTMTERVSLHEKTLIEKVEERTMQVDQQRAILVQKSKLASLGEMAGGIAHEINTPLAVIKISLDQINENIEEKNFDSDDMKKSVLLMKKTTDRIAKIINGLRFIARDGSHLPMSRSTVDSIIEDTFSFCSEKMRLHSIELRINKRCDTENLTINCQSVEISQVILNLLNNAHDAIIDLPEKWIEVIIDDLGDHVEISLVDCGKGIPIELQEKIMQPFFTTKELGKGTGLGLSISQGIIQAHDGRLFIDNQSPNTKFTIILPKNFIKKEAA